MNREGQATHESKIEETNETQVKCTHCGEIYKVDSLDPVMRCPKCNETGWVPVKPSGERADKPVS
jgi:DNA-directed RNA polymerase subunit RPC12/RpoP